MKKKINMAGNIEKEVYLRRDVSGRALRADVVIGGKSRKVGIRVVNAKLGELVLILGLVPNGVYSYSVSEIGRGVVGIGSVRVSDSVESNNSPAANTIKNVSELNNDAGYVKGVGITKISIGSTFPTSPEANELFIKVP